MKLLIITTGCNPSGGAFSVRVHSLAQMASQAAQVSVLSIYDSHDPQIPGVKFYHQSFPEKLLPKLKRLANYYRTDYQPIQIEDEPDIVQIEHPNLFGLAKQFSNKPIILDEHNVWWQLEEFNIQEGPTVKKLPLRNHFMKWLLKCAKKYELNILKKSRRIIVCSNSDRQEFIKEIPEIKNKITYIPNCIDVDRYKPEKSNSNIVLFMGSLIYYPNIDAVRLICNEIAPHTKAEIQILGEGPSLSDVPDNVKFLGRVEDVRSYVQKAKICIAPLRYGSGSRIKILEYMALEKATISTTKGAEGLELNPQKDIIIEDNIKQYPLLINQMIENNTLLDEMGRQARHTIEMKYDYRLYSDTLKEIYSQL